MTKDEALKLALEALDGLSEPYGVLKAQDAIKEALAQPEQEPVAIVTNETGNPDITMSWWHEPALPVGTPLYTTPPQEQQSCDKRTWVGLTDEEIDKIYEAHHNQYGECESVNFGYERAIETKLKEKNT